MTSNPKFDRHNSTHKIGTGGSSSWSNPPPHGWYVFSGIPPQPLELISQSAPAHSSDWKEGEFVTYNIHVVDTSESAFFNEVDIPSMDLHHIPATILDNEERPDDDLTKAARLFYSYIQLVEMSGTEWTASRVNDFTAYVLRLLSFDEPDRVVCQNVEIAFPAGKHAEVLASIDVCVMNNIDFVLVVHECRVSCLAPAYVLLP
jgi:hypothetical protein